MDLDNRFSCYCQKTIFPSWNFIYSFICLQFFSPISGFLEGHPEWMKIKTQQIFTFQIYEYVHDCHLLQSKHLKSKMKRADTIHDSAQMIVKTFD